MSDVNKNLQNPENHFSFFEKAVISEEEEYAYREAAADEAKTGKTQTSGMTLDIALRLLTIASVLVAGGLFFAIIFFMRDYTMLPPEVSSYITVSANSLITVYIIVAGLSIGTAVFFNWAIRRPINHMLKMLVDLQLLQLLVI